jgi:simple sugar transport system permease protein
MDLTLVLAAGIGLGTVLLFAAIGEIFAERAGVLNLGVEGMMLIGAVAAYSTAVGTGNAWLGVPIGMAAAAGLSLLHAVVTIHLRADQVISGLALTFLGTGLARVLGEGLSNAGSIGLLPRFSIPLVSDIPVIGPIFFHDQSVLAYVGYLLVPLAWYWINRTRPGLDLRAVGERPSAADAQGIDVVRLRYAYVLVGGLLAGLAGATITLAVSPGWFGDLTTNGRGWIAVGARDLRPLEPDPCGNRGLHLRCDLPPHPGHPGPEDHPRRAEPLRPRAFDDVLPRDAAVPVRDRRRGRRVTRGAPPAPRRACRARSAVRSRGARRVASRVHLVGGSSAARSVQRHVIGAQRIRGHRLDGVGDHEDIEPALPLEGRHRHDRPHEPHVLREPSIARSSSDRDVGAPAGAHADVDRSDELPDGRTADGETVPIVARPMEEQRPARVQGIEALAFREELAAWLILTPGPSARVQPAGTLISMSPTVAVRGPAVLSGSGVLNITKSRKCGMKVSRSPVVCPERASRLTTTA